ncbi:BON domain-containing protein [Chitinispirillales bacterium ANBcel5]|uniref:BON domain-containing protein n=1 Tax=Cellulosispirillum alkaliphilum TaxID=3039283 RepID=UPI002A5333FE|nr:BON domain-containing protein [Chitinispirillales bacterium ANBcel5]
MTRSSPELERIVKDHLTWDSRLDGFDINVKVRNNTAHLSGTVTSYMARQAAGEDAMSIPGIAAVDNVIEVVGDTISGSSDDQKLAKIIKRTIDLYPHLDPKMVDVVARGNEVTLTGDVDTFWKKLRAEELAFNITGVKRVHNKLDVVPSHSLKDETIAREIRQAIERTEKLDSSHIDIKVDNGTVTLFGEVSNQEVYSSINEIVTHTRGVTNINNELLVSNF